MVLLVSSSSDGFQLVRLFGGVHVKYELFFTQ